MFQNWINQSNIIQSNIMHISVNGDYIDTDVKVGVAVLKFLAVECQMFPAILIR